MRGDRSAAKHVTNKVSWKAMSLGPRTHLGFWQYNQYVNVGPYDK